MTFRRRYFDGEVTSPQISSEAVTEDKIADNSVTSEKIKDETIKSVDIAPGQVRTEDIADGAVTLAKMGGDVSVIPLMDGSVTNTKLATDAVSTDKIANGAVTSDKLPSGAVTSLKIADGSVIASKLATNAVTQTKIAPNSVGWSEIRPQSLEPEQIKTLSGEPPLPGQVPVYDESEGNLWWFRWATPGGAVRPLVPPVATDEIADGAVTPEKLSFVPGGFLYKVVTCIIPVGINSITTDPDPELVDGQILGYYPSQPVSSWVSGLALNADGSITIRSYVEIQFANATFRVVVLRAS